MIHQKLRKVGDRYVVTIPKEVVERLGLREGQLLAIHIHPALSDAVREAFEESWRDNEPGYRYLADR